MASNKLNYPCYFTGPKAAEVDFGTLFRAVDGVAHCELHAPRRASRWYLDTPEETARRHNLVLEATADGVELRLGIRPRHSEQQRWSLLLESLPRTVADVPQPAARRYLAGVINGAPLSAVDETALELTTLALRDARDKLVATVTLETDVSGHHPLIRLATRPGFSRIGRRAAKSLRAAGFEPLLEGEPARWWQRAPEHRPERRPEPETDPARDRMVETAANTFRSYVQLIELHRAGVIEDRDPEHLHQYRVSLRKTRSLFEALRPAFQADRFNYFKREFGKLNRTAGAQRDLDVLAELLPQFLDAQPRGAEVAEHAESVLREERKAAHEALVALLRSEWYRNLRTEWDKCVAEFAAHDAHALNAERLAALPSVGAMVETLFTSAIKVGRKAMRTRKRPQLHDTRKKIKRLRYLMESFAAILPESSVALITEDTKGLQKAFGHFCDLELETDFLEHCRQRAGQHRERGFDDAIDAIVDDLNAAIDEQIELCAYRFRDFDSKRVRKQVKALASGT